MLEIDFVKHWQPGRYTLSLRGYQHLIDNHAQHLFPDMSSPIIARDGSWVAYCHIADWYCGIVALDYYPLTGRWPVCEVYQLETQVIEKEATPCAI